VRVVGKVEARFRIGGTAAGVDLEGADLPIGGNRSHQAEDQQQADEKQPETETPPTATFRLLRLGRRGWTPGYEAHLMTTLAPADYDACFACGSAATGLLRGCDDGFTTLPPAWLPRRPVHGAPAEQVKMQMVDGLAGLRSLVEHQAITIAIDLALVRHLVGDLQHAAQ
jgi:hypothetical protein